MAARVPWHLLVSLLLDRCDELTGEISRRMRQQLTAYRELAPEQYHRYVSLTLETTLRLARSQPAPLSAAQTAVLERVGAAQAQLGVPVEQMLLAWRIGVDTVLEHGTAEADRSELGADQLLGFVRGALAASDVGMVITARAHRGTELERDREAQDRTASFVRALLAGIGDSAQLRATAQTYGLDPTACYHAVRAEPGTDGSWLRLRRAVGLATAEAAGRGMSVLIDGDLAGFQVGPPGDARPGRAGVGPALPLERLGESFRLATRALRTSRAFGLTGTCDLAELGPRAAVIDDADVGAALRRRYLDPLAGSGSGPEIVATLRAYLAAGLHVRTAAEVLHLHPNTVRYRLARFEELAVADLSAPLTAFEVWWAVESASLDAADL